MCDKEKWVKWWTLPIGEKVERVNWWWKGKQQSQWHCSALLSYTNETGLNVQCNLHAMHTWCAWAVLTACFIALTNDKSVVSLFSKVLCTSFWGTSMMQQRNTQHYVSDLFLKWQSFICLVCWQTKYFCCFCIALLWFGSPMMMHSSLKVHQRNSNCAQPPIKAVYLTGILCFPSFFYLRTLLRDFSLSWYRVW